MRMKKLNGVSDFEKWKRNCEKYIYSTMKFRTIPTLPCLVIYNYRQINAAGALGCDYKFIKKEDF